MIFKRLILILGSVAGLAACTSQAQLDDTPVQRTVMVGQNYQQVYAHMNRQVRTCLANDAFSVDGQLYSELHYGEITLGGNSLTFMPYLYANISRDGTGARVDLKSLFPNHVENSLKWAEYWANGGDACSVYGFNVEPPSL